MLLISPNPGCLPYKFSLIYSFYSFKYFWNFYSDNHSQPFRSWPICVFNLTINKNLVFQLYFTMFSQNIVCFHRSSIRQIVLTKCLCLQEDIGRDSLPISCYGQRLSFILDSKSLQTTFCIQRLFLDVFANTSLKRETNLCQ